MNSKIKILGKSFPVGLLIAALVVASAGAAVGTVLSGQVQGEMPVAVSQALLVGTPTNNGNITASGYVNAQGLDESNTVPQNVVDGCGGTYSSTAGAIGVAPGNWDVVIPVADRFIGVARDDHTPFQAAAEIDAGDCFVINLPLKNASNQTLVGTITLNIPAGLTAEVVADTVASASGTGNISAIVRTGANTWKFTLGKDALYLATDELTVVVAAGDDAAPGFYTLSGSIKQISY